MAQSKIAVGLALPPKPPLSSLKQVVFAARVMRFDSFMLWDHLQDIFPLALWEKDFTWVAGQNTSPHEFYEFQTMLGYLASRAGRMRLGVAVTNPISRHPVLIAQAMLTLSHLTKRAPVLGIGTGERAQLGPYGIEHANSVSKLEEALKIIRRCFSSQGPINFAGKYYQLDHAPVDLQAPKRKVPEIWVGALGPRMLQLTGTYGDGWCPLGLITPDEYAAKLDVVRASARESGRDPAAILPSLQPYVVVAPTEEEVGAMMQHKVIRFFGLLVPAEAWRKLGHVHPFGEGFRGIADFLPEQYTKAEYEEAIALVPDDLASVGLVSGTPEQVAKQLRAYGDAGMRHVAPQLMSAAISRRTALYGLRALRKIARSLG